MAGFNPVNFIAGPAIVTFDSDIFYSRGDITVRTRRETWNVETAMHGKIDERLKSQAFEISFVPCGEVEDIGRYFPYNAASIGKSIFATVDKTLVIQTLAGQAYTFARAAMIKSPSLRLSAGDVPFGEMTFLALLKTSTEPTTEASHLAVAAVAFSDANFDETKITSPGYTAAWGTSPYAAMESVDGFSVDIGYRFREDYIDRYGLVNVRLVSIEPSANFTPVGLTEAEWDALVIPDGATTVLPGQSLGKAGTSLVISKAATFLKVTIPGAGPKDYGLAFGDAPRFSAITFVAKRAWTAGVAAEPFTVEIQAA